MRQTKSLCGSEYDFCILGRLCVLQCVAVCCSVLQCVAVCCSVLQCFFVFLGDCVCLLWTMGWIRLAGSIKLQVSFAKEPYKRDDILQKRPLVYRCYWPQPHRIEKYRPEHTRRVLSGHSSCYFSVLELVGGPHLRIYRLQGFQWHTNQRNLSIYV